MQKISAQVQQQQKASNSPLAPSSGPGPEASAQLALFLRQEELPASSPSKDTSSSTPKSAPVAENSTGDSSLRDSPQKAGSKRARARLPGKRSRPDTHQRSRRSPRSRQRQSFQRQAKFFNSEPPVLQLELKALAPAPPPLPTLPEELETCFKAAYLAWFNNQQHFGKARKRTRSTGPRTAFSS